MLLESTNVQTIIREISADLETPVSLYLKLRGDGASFLLESVEGGERIARYSFIGVQPRAEYILRGDEIEIKDEHGSRVIKVAGDPTRFLQNEMDRFPAVRVPNAPRFTGGLVGFLGFESVRFFEPTLGAKMKRGSLPDGIYMLADTIVAFDHARRSIFLIANVLDGNTEAANQKLDAIEARIQQPLPPAPKIEIVPSKIKSNHTQGTYEDMVRAAKENILAGDIFQVVLSQRFTRETNVEPFDVYRAVRRLNPSPYMFYFDFPDFDLQIVGASPEMHVRLSDGIASVRPIAGTRWRGKTKEEDDALAEELLNDPKERAEHVMLVDLGRNDIGRVSDYGTVQVEDLMVIERYSHVMHIVSQVEGQMRADMDAFDLLRATFPAGTLSGAPKVRAMEIIEELEGQRRSLYGGVVGHVGYDGNMDTCIAIRTMVVADGKVHVQAGAGIVADSDPTSEYLECGNKAKALFVAVDRAEQGLL